MLAMLPLTCGLIVETSQGWLLGRVTNLGYWDLPKGKMEEGEAPQDAAIRECIEETGLDFSAFRHELEDLGVLAYNTKRGKTLHLFRLRLDADIDLSQCTCSTWVNTRGDEAVLDMDAWEWVSPSDVLVRVNRRMGKQLVKRQLLNGSPRPKRRAGSALTP